jgi:hypothetical protein
MAGKQRGLGAKGWIDRLVDKLGSVKAAAEQLGRAPSTISDIRSGKRPGTALRDAARDLVQGKKSPVKPPPSKGRPAPVSKHPNTKKLAKAQKKLLKLDKRGVDKVVIYINIPGAGKSITLGAHGGISINEILKANSLKEFLEEQAERQHYSLKLLPEDVESEPGDEDWESTDIVDSIVIEEYIS